MSHGAAGIAASLVMLLGVLAVAVAGCGQDPQRDEPSPPAGGDGIPPLVCGTALPPTPPASQQSGPPVTITDRHGRAWDISVPVYKYGFDADEFDYGLGVGVIRPISAPDIFAPGDSGYPSPGDDFQLVGLTRRGEARAYPIDILSQHEIVNDFIGDAHLAVSY